MYKVTIENLILKKGWEKFIMNFYDPSATFFVILQFGTEEGSNSSPRKVRHHLANYLLKLGANNTRFLKRKSFEWLPNNKHQFWFQLLFIENKSSKPFVLESIQQALDIEKQIEKNNDLNQIGRLEFNLPVDLSVPNDNIVFKNKRLELTLFLHQK